jgi:glycosyltransferase involved in cell wall biosynthesis
MNTPFVSVIIPVYNDAERLTRCLAALEDQTYPKDRYEVIVIDNGAGADLVPLAASYPQVRLVAESWPGSYAARNRGLSVARGEVLAFTDSDCVPLPDWIEKGVAALLRVPDCGLVGGKVEVFFRDPKRPTAVELYESRTAFLQQEYIEVGRFAVTANLFTFRKVVDDVGVFDAELKSGGDLEWGQRVAAHGYPLVYAEDARVAHPARSSYRELYRKVARTVGGIKDMQGRKNCRFLGWGRGFVIDSLPPMRSSLRAWRDPGLRGVGSKLKVIAVLFFVQYAQVWESIRLWLGGTSRR